MTRPKGKLIPIGGGEARSDEDERDLQTMREPSFAKDGGILRELLHEVKGVSPCIIVIPAASSQPREMVKIYKQAFEQLDCPNCDFIYINEREDADKDENLKKLAKADGVLFTGGDQKVLIDKLIDTQFLDQLQQRYLHEDFVIAGTSAGAAAMAHLMIRDGKSNDTLVKGMVDTEKGLALLTGAIIDTHFNARGRLPRLTEALLKNPGLVGIGLCEDTGLVITEGNKVRAIGSGGVTLIETDELKHTNYNEIPELEPVYLEHLKVHVLAQGASFLLRERKFIPSKGQAAQL